MKITKQSAIINWTTPDAMLAIERATRTAYQSEGAMCPGSAEKLIKKILHLKHESCLEHASASFTFITDRGITHELVRHRIASFTQESTRYVKYGDLEVIEPLWDEKDPPGARQAWLNAMILAEQAYSALIDAGMKPQVARDVLPTCTKAQIVVTCNFREWLHIIQLRTAKDAHPKIRQLIGYVYDQLKNLYPVIFNEENAKRTCDWIIEAKKNEKDSIKLAALEAAGVDNWEGYHEAIHGGSDHG